MHFLLVFFRKDKGVMRVIDRLVSGLSALAFTNQSLLDLGVQRPLDRALVCTPIVIVYNLQFM